MFAVYCVIVLCKLVVLILIQRIGVSLSLTHIILQVWTENDMRVGDMLLQNATMWSGILIILE